MFSMLIALTLFCSVTFASNDLVAENNRLLAQNKALKVAVQELSSSQNTADLEDELAAINPIIQRSNELLAACKKEVISKHEYGVGLTEADTKKAQNRAMKVAIKRANRKSVQLAKWTAIIYCLHRKGIAELEGEVAESDGNFDFLN